MINRAFANLWTTELSRAERADRLGQVAPGSGALLCGALPLCPERTALSNCTWAGALGQENGAITSGLGLVHFPAY